MRPGAAPAGSGRSQFRALASGVAVADGGPGFCQPVCCFGGHPPLCGGPRLPDGRHTGHVRQPERPDSLARVDAVLMIIEPGYERLQCLVIVLGSHPPPLRSRGLAPRRGRLRRHPASLRTWLKGGVAVRRARYPAGPISGAGAAGIVPPSWPSSAAATRFSVTGSFAHSAASAGHHPAVPSSAALFIGLSPAGHHVPTWGGGR